MTKHFQVFIALAFVVAFVIDVTVFGPTGYRLFLLGAELGLLVAGFLMSKQLREIDPSTGEFGVAAFVAAIVLVAPFAGSGVDGRQRIIFTVLGYLGAICAWVLLRLGPRRQYVSRTLGARLWLFTSMALGAALCFSLIATVLIAIASISAKEGGPDLGHALFLTYRGYFVAAVLVGPAVALLFPLTRWTLGALLVAMVAMALIYTPAGPATRALSPGEDPVSDLAIGIVIALFGGPVALAAMWNKDMDEVVPIAT